MHAYTCTCRCILGYIRKLLHMRVHACSSVAVYGGVNARQERIETPVYPVNFPWTEPRRGFHGTAAAAAAAFS